jgi:lipopolysaccharide transport system ATP-binding protein
LKIMTVIKVENLSKVYKLGGASHNSLRDALASFIKKPLARNKKEELDALKNINFEVNEGETLGIIGNNGAGKSTLLKILSRITKPTTGSIELHGRVGSLLEVGTGFHNELSGRENIYLNGAILGMKRTEIENKFGEIVAFSEIERFLDTPVKHYSSGMYMRLAFAVAAHLEPEILIVDEVLAVGDMAFQKKCLRKMREVGETGRTVLFVSHDMQSISRLCTRVIWLKNGELVKDGETGEVVGAYLREQAETSAEKSWENASAAPGNDIVKLSRVRVCDEIGKTRSTFDIRNPVEIEMTYEVLYAGKVFVSNFHFYNEHGICIFVSQDLDTGWRTRPRSKGIYVSKIRIPGNFLAEGTVFVTAAITTFQPLEVHFAERDVIAFHVIDNFEEGSTRGDYTGVLPGVVRPQMNWETDIHSKTKDDI